jgi:hypothetical protein
MRLTCNRTEQMLRIKPVVVRSGGGHAAKTTYMRYVYCYKKSTCIATVGVSDVRGKEKYWFTNDPQGTWVSQGLKYSDLDCTSGIACSGKVRYF